MPCTTSHVTKIYEKFPCQRLTANEGIFSCNISTVRCLGPIFHVRLRCTGKIFICPQRQTLGALSFVLFFFFLLSSSVAALSFSVPSFTLDTETLTARTVHNQTAYQSFGDTAMEVSLGHKRKQQEFSLVSITHLSPSSSSTSPSPPVVACFSADSLELRFQQDSDSSDVIKFDLQAAQVCIFFPSFHFRLAHSKAKQMKRKS